MVVMPTYNERVRMSKSIPKLRTEADWEEWYSAIRIVLGTVDDHIWAFVEGRYDGPQFPTERDEIIRHIAFIENVPPEEVTNAQVVSYEQDAASARGWWLSNIGRAWFLLWCTLGPKPRQQVSQVNNVRSAIALLHVWRRSSLWQPNCLRWAIWTSIRFKEGQNAVEFVTKWQKALDDLEYVTDEISTFVQFHVFMDATRDHPFTQDFRNHLATETYDTISMPTVIGRFLAHMSVS